MNTEDYEAFRDVLHGVHDFYERQLSAFALDVWWQALKSYDLQAVTRAFGVHTVNPDTGQFMPKPADIVRMMSGGTSDNAMRAWSKVDQAVRSVGVYESVVFDDPLIHRALEDMGGWIGLGMKNEDDWPFVAKEFENRYRGYAMRQECGDYLRVMMGIMDAQNQRNGHQAGEPLLIGDPVKCKAVLSGGVVTSGMKVQRLRAVAGQPSLTVLRGGKDD